MADEIGSHEHHEHHVAEQVKDVSDHLTRLVREHVELAKSEVTTSVRKAGKDLGFTVAGAALLAVGYVLLMFAIGYGLGDRIGVGRAFLLISGVHVATGLALVLVFAKKLRTVDKPGLPATQRELARDKVFLGQVGHIVRDDPHSRGP